MDSEYSEDSEPCKYFQIQACGPGGIADADGGFAKRLLDVCQKYAAKSTPSAPAGFMEWPRDFSKVKWKPGELTMSGGEDYLVPFGPQKAIKSQPQKEESKSQILPVAP